MVARRTSVRFLGFVSSAILGFSGAAFPQGFQQIPVGGLPVGVSVGDLNGDGRPDFLTANSVTNNLSVCLAYGSMVFSPAVNYTSGSDTRALALVDLNGDGKLDVLAVNAGSNNVLEYKGNGTGGLNSPSYFPAGSAAYGIAAGDLNGDGNVDAVTANLNGNNVSILLGNGAGAFAPATSVAAAGGACGVVISDLNGDGKADLAVSNLYSSSVSILLGLGNGSFNAATAVPVASGPLSIEVGDWNGDTKKDLITANITNSDVSLLIGNGNGTFAAAVSIPMATGTSDVAAGDLNGDGKLDFATANAGGGPDWVGTASVALGNGAGGFSLPIAKYSTGGKTTSIALRDLDGDGKLDLVTANALWGNVTILKGNGNGGFQSPVNVNVGAEPTYLAIGDLNADGLPDVVVETKIGDVRTMLGLGGFQLSNPSPLVIANAIGGVVVADLNGDGIPDLLMNTWGSNLYIRFGTGGGAFVGSTFVPVPGSTSYSIAVGDLNGDGLPDIARANNTGSAILVLATSPGVYGSAVAFPFSAPLHDIAIADLNNDGKRDLVAANHGSVSVALGTGGGAFASPVPYLLGNITKPASVAVSDLNGDGNLDVVFASTAITVMLGNGVGVLSQAGSYNYGPGAGFVAVGDLDGDGRSDLLGLPSPASGSSVNQGYPLEIFGNGAGGFPAYKSVSWGAAPFSGAVADLNCDGYADIVMSISLTQDIALIPNLAPTPYGSFAYGTGTHGCAGKISLVGNAAPKINSPAYRLNCTNAPANALGLGLLTDQPDFIGSDALGLGFLTHVDLFQSALVVPFTIGSDESGTASAAAPIPNDPALIAHVFCAQSIWIESKADGLACGPSPYHFTSSSGLLLVVQP